MKRFLTGLCLATLALAPAAHAGTTSQSGRYTTSVFIEDCESGTGVVCFDVSANVQTLQIDIDDAWPFPVTAYAEIFAPNGQRIGGGDQFCDTHQIALGGQTVGSVIVHVGGFMRGDCGPIPFVDPFEGGEGSFTPAIAGTVTITY